MPHYRIDLPDGGTLWAHMRLRKPEPAPCGFPDPTHPAERCGRVTIARCDWPVGKGTCSAPICEKHRLVVGPDRDHCPRHAQRALPLGES